MEVSKTQRNKAKFHFEGNSYIFKKTMANGDEWWECDQRRNLKCRGRIIKTGDHGRVEAVHVHPSDLVSSKVQIVRSSMKEAAVSTRDNPGVIVRTSTAGVSDPVAARLPSRNTMTKTIRNARKGTENHRLPANLEDFRVPEELRVAINGGDFLQWDSWPDETRILIFASPKGLEILSESRVWNLDGTFKSAPRLFHQIYTIHGYIRGKSFPLVYCLLPNKRQGTYETMLEKVKQIRQGMQPEVLIIDFERSVINAIRKCFPNAEIKGCSFHFNQSLWRKIQSMPEVCNNYKNDVDYSTEIKKLGALAYRKVEDVRNSYEALLETNFFQRGEVRELLDYFERTWIGIPPRQNQGWIEPTFALQLWNLHQSVENNIARTNNGVEGWHYRFQSLLGIDHPNILKLIDQLRLEEDSIRVEIARLEAGGKVSPRKKRYREIDDKILRVFEDYEEITALGFLRRISHIITLG